MATSNLLKETSRVTKVTATVEDANGILHEITYETTSDGKTLKTCTDNMRGTKDNSYKGAMSINADGFINTNFNDATIDTVAMMTLFNSIIAEIKAGLTA